MKISDLIGLDSIVLNLDAATKEQALEEISKIAADNTNLSDENILEVLLEREKICSTAVDEGVAIPHGKISALNKIYCLIARSQTGIDFDSLDEKPTKIFILLLTPEDNYNQHIEALSTVSKIFKNSQLREKVLEAGTVDEIHELITDKNGKQD